MIDEEFLSDIEESDWHKREDLKKNPGKVSLPDDLTLLLGAWTAKDVTARIYKVLGIEKQTIPKDFTFDGKVDDHHVIVKAASYPGQKQHRVFFVIVDEDDTETLVSCGRIIQYLEARQ